MKHISLKDIVLSDLPLGFVPDFLSKLSQGYSESRSRASEYSGYEAKNIFPYIRRSICEGIFRKAAQDANLDCEARTNTQGNNHYTWAKANRLLLTISHIRSEKGMPRQAKLRSQYSEINQHLAQSDMFYPNTVKEPGRFMELFFIT